MEVLSDRKKALFGAIVDDYIASAKPVGSKMIVEKHDFDVSSATIRNDMKELETLGLLTHPHTSAGRIPTAKGYQYYVEQFVDIESSLSIKQQSDLDDLNVAIKSETPEVQVKTLAKGLAELSNEAVLVRINKHSFYYTGISNIFRKPEFNSAEVMYSITELIDHLDDILQAISVSELIDIFIGKENPVSPLCSTVITKYSSPESEDGLIALLGPLRMDYQYNYQLIKSVKNLLNS